MKGPVSIVFQVTMWKPTLAGTKNQAVRGARRTSGKPAWNASVRTETTPSRETLCTKSGVHGPWNSSMMPWSVYPFAQPGPDVASFVAPAKK